MSCRFLDLSEGKELLWTVCVSYSIAVQKVTYSIKDTIARHLILQQYQTMLLSC